jgi:hypothetical protein
MTMSKQEFSKLRQYVYSLEKQLLINNTILQNQITQLIGNTIQQKFNTITNAGQTNIILPFVITLTSKVYINGYRVIEGWSVGLGTPGEIVFATPFSGGEEIIIDRI